MSVDVAGILAALTGAVVSAALCWGTVAIGRRMDRRR